MLTRSVPSCCEIDFLSVYVSVRPETCVRVALEACVPPLLGARSDGAGFRPNDGVAAQRTAADSPIRHETRSHLRLHVPREVVEDRLPARALLLDGVRRLAVEGDTDGDAIRAGCERDSPLAAADRGFDDV